MVLIPQGQEKRGFLKVQRTSLFIFTVTSVLLLVYSLGFLTSAYIFYAFGDERLWEFYMEMQGINTGFLFKAVMAIVFALAMFAMQVNKHVAGPYTVIAVLLVSVASVFFSADSLVRVAAMRQSYTMLDLSSLDRYIELGSISYQYSTLTFDLGIIVYGMFALAAMFMAITVVRNAVTVREFSGQEVTMDGGKP